MTQRLYVTVRFTAKPGKVEALLDLLAILVSKTKSEAGCLEYGYYRLFNDPTIFTSFEIWKDLESEAAHWETQHQRKALTRLPELIEGEAEVTKYEKVAWPDTTTSQLTEAHNDKA